MLRYGSGRTVSTTTTTTEDSSEYSSERRIRRLRLTLHAGDNGNKEAKTANSGTAEKEKDVSASWKKKKNGMIQRERPAGRESPQQHLGDMTNGAPETSLQLHGPKVYGIVQRMGSDRQQEVMAREWTVDHLQDEMKYIREVRDSLEKVRERMYGQFGGMQQSMQKLSQEIKAANASRRSLESEVRIRTNAMESFDQMNSSLISANIDLQKSLLENCQSRVDKRDEVKSLRSTYEKAQDTLRDKERELAAAHAENETLRLQVESSREASTQALQELSAKLQCEFKEKLQEEQRKHREEIENLQAQLDEYIRRLEEAETNTRIAEAKIAERDQRIIELDRLLDCMGKEKSQLNQKLQDCEQRLRLLELTDTTDANVAKKSKELQSEAVNLKERIKHLNDMVFCQQRKVKGMIEEVGTLRSQVAQKDMFISELLDRIAIVECENNELEDKLKYFMSTQNRPREALETREIGLGCDLLPRHEAQRFDVEPPVQSESSHLHPIKHLPPAQPPPPVKLPSLPEAPSPPSPTHPSFPYQASPPPQTPPLPKPSPPPQPPSLTKHSPPPQPPSMTPPTQPSTPSLPPSPSPPIQHPSVYLTSPINPRTFRSNNPPPSRLESSLLRYTPVEYSRFLQSNPSVTLPNTRQSESEPPVSPVQSRDELTVMSSSWTGRQGQVGDLKHQSKEELQELLQRQENILSNKRLLQILPDKGKKIKEFAEKVRLAIQLHDEEERRQSLVSAVSTELQSKYKQAFTVQQRAHPNTQAPSNENRQSERAAGDAIQDRESSPVSVSMHENDTLEEQQDQFVSSVAAGETMETAVAGASLNSAETKEGDLVEALERVRLSETSSGFNGESKDPIKSTARENNSLKEIPKKPHFVTFLENKEKTSAPRKQQFKPNQLLHRSDVSPSGSSSPSQSSAGSSPLPAQDRRERDRKHLDDITSARLPPLHYSPAQLLSLEESAILLTDQTKKQQELQAKLAAQKLSEGLKISMGSYTPDGGPMAAYREVHDEAAQLSSEED
ncbi:protein GRINL1A [Tautogolabrus adspersus]